MTASLSFELRMSGNLQVDLENGVNVEKFVQRFAKKVQTGILKDTAQGKGSAGRFPPYSDSYRETRIDHGAGVAFRDLNLTGKMLGALQLEASENSARLYFSNQTEGAKAHGHHYGNRRTELPSTQFFARSEEDITKYVESLKHILIG